MPDDILGLEIGGEDITLAQFATGVVRLRSLINGLAAEIGVTARIDWVVESLETGSALQRWKGIARKPSRQPEVTRVVEAYLRIGKSLEFGEEVHTQSRELLARVDRLVKVIDKQVEYLRFETSMDDAVVRTREALAEVALPDRALFPPTTFGAIEGRVQTLSSRGSLRFTLFDVIYDRGVSCYLREDQQDLMRDAWGRLATVEGTIRRDPVTGRPMSVRNIRNVYLLPEPTKNAYLEARGIAPSHSGLSPEEAIRRLRDDE